MKEQLEKKRQKQQWRALVVIWGLRNRIWEPKLVSVILGKHLPRKLCTRYVVGKGLRLSVGRAVCHNSRNLRRCTFPSPNKSDYRWLAQYRFDFDQFHTSRKFETLWPYKPLRESQQRGQVAKRRLLIQHREFSAHKRASGRWIAPDLRQKTLVRFFSLFVLSLTAWSVKLFTLCQSFLTSWRQTFLWISQESPSIFGWPLPQSQIFGWERTFRPNKALF